MLFQSSRVLINKDQNCNLVHQLREKKIKKFSDIQLTPLASKVNVILVKQSASEHEDQEEGTKVVSS